jgi:hypothetical protein
MAQIIRAGGAFGANPRFPQPLPQSTHVVFMGDFGEMKYLVLPQPIREVRSWV